MKKRVRSFLDYIGSRRFAIILLIITTSVILVANLIPNPILMSEADAEKFVREKPLLYGISNLFHVMNITKNPFFVTIPLAILISITVCTYRRAAKVLRDSKGSIPAANRLHCSHRGQADLPVALSTLKKRGWKVARKEEGGEAIILYGGKGKNGIWGSVVFHVGMNIVIIGGISSMLTQYNRDLHLTEGFETEPVSVLGELSSRESKDFPYLKMYLRSFNAVYTKENFALDYAATVDTLDKYGNEKREIIRVNQPLRRGGYQFLLDHYYFAPRFIITEKNDGRVVLDAYINLMLLDPKQTDEFEIPDTDIKVRARFFPDFSRDGDTIRTRSRNLNDPVFILEFFKGTKKLGDGLLPLNKKLDFDEERYTIEFNDLRKWMVIAVSRDYGLPVVKWGLLLVVTGLLARFFMNEKNVWVIVGKEHGIMELGGRAQYFPALFDEELRRLGEALKLKTYEL